MCDWQDININVQRLHNVYEKYTFYVFICLRVRAHFDWRRNKQYVYIYTHIIVIIANQLKPMAPSSFAAVSVPRGKKIYPNYLYRIRTTFVP